MRKWMVSFIVVCSLFIANTSIVAHAETQATAGCSTEEIAKLKGDMEKLWIDHAWWTRSLIVSGLADSPDYEMVVKGFKENLVELGNGMKTFYGEKAGNEYTKLLEEHILLAQKIIAAAKKGDQQNVDKLNKRWYKNADETVNFLVKLNPNWSKQVLKEMFYKHLGFATDEVMARLKKDWASDIRALKHNEAHLIHMSDTLAAGIVKQFPEKFNCTQE